MIEKKYDLKLKDFFKYNFFFRVVFQLVIYVFLVGFLAYFVEISIHKEKGVNWGEANPYLEILGFFALGFVLITGYLILVTYLGTKRAFLANRQVFDGVHLIFEEKGVSQVFDKKTQINDETKTEEVVQESRVDTIAYSEIFKLVNRFGLLVILINKQQGLIVPTKLFTKDELAQVQSWHLQSHQTIIEEPISDDDKKTK